MLAENASAKVVWKTAEDQICRAATNQKKNLIASALAAQDIIRKSAKIKTGKAVWNQQKMRAAIKPAKNKTGKVVLKSQQITAVTSSPVSNPPINFLSNLINGILRHARLEKHIMHWPNKDFLGNSASFGIFCSHIPISTFCGVWEVWLVQKVPAHKSLSLWKLPTWLTYPSLLFWQPVQAWLLHPFIHLCLMTLWNSLGSQKVKIYHWHWSKKIIFQTLTIVDFLNY